LGKDNAGEDSGGVIKAGFWSKTEGGGSMMLEEMARDRRCVCPRDRFPAIDGTEVKERGEAGGEEGNVSSADGRWSDGIDSK